MKRNQIATVETPEGPRAARLNPVELEVIHLFVQLARALNHPCKIYNALAVQAPIIYIGPKPSHVTEILDELGAENSQVRVEHGEVEKLAENIRRLAAESTGQRLKLPATSLTPFSKCVLLPKMIEVVAGTPVD